MKTQEFKKKILASLDDVKRVDYDGCHKIYLRAYDNDTNYPISINVEDVDKQTIVDLVKEFYDDSCELRFVQKVYNDGSSDDDYQSIIGQFQ